MWRRCSTGCRSRGRPCSGMSMGGYAALAFAARHRERLSALVLADTRAAADSAEARAGRAAALATLAGAGPAAYLAGSLPRLLSPDAPPALVAHVRAPRRDARRQPARRHRGAARPPRSVRRAGRHRLPDAGRVRRRGSGDARGRDEADRGRDRGRALRPDRGRRPPVAPRGARRVPARGDVVPRRARRRRGRHEAGRDLLRSRAGARPTPPPSSSASTAPTSRWCSGPAWAASPIGWRARAASPTRRCPAFPRRPSPGHPGRLVAGTIAGKTALLLCGRVHGYEGYSPCEIGFGVRVVAALGVRTLIVTNAAGGVDPTLAAGRHRRDLRPHQPDRRVAAVRAQRRTAGTALRRHDRRLRPDAARDRGVAAPAAIGRAAARGDLRRHGRPRLRDARRGAPAAHAGRRAGRDVDGARGDRGAPRRPRRARAVAGRQPRRRRQPRSAAPRGRHARRRTRARTRWAS